MIRDRVSECHRQPLGNFDAGVKPRSEDMLRISMQQTIQSGKAVRVLHGGSDALSRTLSDIGGFNVATLDMVASGDFLRVRRVDHVR